MDHTTRSSGPRSTKHQNFRPKNTTTRCHVPPEGTVITSVISRTHMRHARHFHHITCSYTPHAMRWHTRLMLWRHGWCHTPLGLTWIDLETWPGPKRLQKKLNKKKKKNFEQVELWLWSKSQNFQKGLFHSVFRVHSDFEARFFIWSSEIVQTVQFLKNWLLHKSWPKSQNFQEVPVLPNFSRRFQFWGLFLHSGIRNCSNSMILQLLALMWTLTKN